MGLKAEPHASKKINQHATIFLGRSSNTGLDAKHRKHTTSELAKMKCDYLENHNTFNQLAYMYMGISRNRKQYSARLRAIFRKRPNQLGGVFNNCLGIPTDYRLF